MREKSGLPDGHGHEMIEAQLAEPIAMTKGQLTGDVAETERYS